MKQIVPRVEETHPVLLSGFGERGRHISATQFITDRTLLHRTEASYAVPVGVFIHSLQATQLSRVEKKYSCLSFDEIITACAYIH